MNDIDTIEALLMYCKKLRAQIEELQHENERLHEEISRIRRNQIQIIYDDEMLKGRLL